MVSSNSKRSASKRSALNSSEWLSGIMFDKIMLGHMGGLGWNGSTEARVYQEAKRAITAHISSELVKAKQEMAAMYSAMGRDDISWGAGGLPKEVLVVFPDYAKSTADIPRGKKQFMDFVQAQLLNGEKT